MPAGSGKVTFGQRLEIKEMMDKSPYNTVTLSHGCDGVCVCVCEKYNPSQRICFSNSLG